MAITKVKRIITSPQAYGTAWIEQFYSANASAAPEEIKAAVSGTQHFITQLHVTFTPGTTAKYWVLVDNNESEITPRTDGIDYSAHWKHKYIKAFPCEVGHAIRILTEASGAISGVVEGFSRQARLRPDEDYTPASASTSASVSTTPSASVSSTPSASLSTSASPSVSSSASDSTSASVSLSPSSSPSASPSVSSTISASPSVSASVS